MYDDERIDRKWGKLSNFTLLLDIIVPVFFIVLCVALSVALDCADSSAH